MAIRVQQFKRPKSLEELENNFSLSSSKVILTKTAHICNICQFLFDFGSTDERVFFVTYVILSLLLIHQAPLPPYDALRDTNLRQHFESKTVQKYLQSAGTHMRLDGFNELQCMMFFSRVD
jgi:hypothetical protein